MFFFLRIYASVTPKIYFMVRQVLNICVFAGFMRSDVVGELVEPHPTNMPVA
jgi:hypothetical protein